MRWLASVSSPVATSHSTTTLCGVGPTRLSADVEKATSEPSAEIVGQLLLASPPLPLSERLNNVVVPATVSRRYTCQILCPGVVSSVSRRSPEMKATYRPSPLTLPNSLFCLAGEPSHRMLAILV